MTVDIPAELENQIVRLSAKADLSPQEYALRSLTRSVTEDSKVKGKVPPGRIEELYRLVDPTYLIEYRCYRCGSEWNDTHDSLVDDECHTCGARGITPLRSEPVHEEVPEHFPGMILVTTSGSMV